MHMLGAFDYFEKGYRQGYEDGREGKSENLEHGMPLLPALLSDQIVTTYCQGYEMGYDQGRRDLILENERKDFERQRLDGLSKG